MGNSSSVVGGSGNSPMESSADMDRWDGIETLGYRVLGVQPDSPASQAGLVSFLDFIVGADGKPLFDSGETIQEGEEYQDVDFPSLLQEFKGQELELVVWNIKSQRQRWVTIIPNDSWGGAGLLGVTIRLDDYAQAEERLIHVLQVEHQSPAQVAGLVEYQDFLLGTTTESLDSTETLSKILYASIDKVVELYVYNCESDVVRVVALMPTWSWGGKGLLGAQVATGYLHRLPSSTQETWGTSLERKVRWVGLAGNNHTPGLSQPSHPLSSTATTTTTTNSSTIPTLEMEPQLEIEADSDAEHHPDDNPNQSKDHPQNGVRHPQSSVISHETTPAPSSSSACVANVMVTGEGGGGEPSESMDSVQKLVSADTVAAAAATWPAMNTNPTAMTGTIPLKPPSSFTGPLLSSTSLISKDVSSSNLAEELFMGPPPQTPPDRKMARRIKEPVKDPSINVFVPPPLLSSPYWTQVATNKIQHQSPLNRPRSMSSASVDH